MQVYVIKFQIVHLYIIGDKMTKYRDIITTLLARELDESTLMSLRDSILAAVATHFRYAEDAFSNEVIRKLAICNGIYFSVIQGVQDALDNNIFYRLENTEPKGGIYPVMRLPSFTIVPRRSNTIDSYRKANYLKDFSIQNKAYEPSTPDLFDKLDELESSNEDAIFLILDVSVDDEQKVDLKFLLPSSDLKFVHMAIPYEAVLDTYRVLDDEEYEPEAAKSVLKATLKDLDRRLG
tara:strand:+ start:1055 stop:1762 length:708 start_codon:yes stop_codon:yes gene_type:complete